MPSTARLACLAVLPVLALVGPAFAQSGDDGFIDGASATAAKHWQTALAALVNGDAAAAETAFGELLAGEPSALRMALLESRSVARNESPGGIILLDQDAATGKLSENGAKVAALLAAGREQLNQADDGWYFASIGRFDVAGANLSALIVAGPDPIALLEFTQRMPQREQLMVDLIDNPVMGDSAREVLRVVAEGERRIKADPLRVQQNIARLAGPPRAFENATARLRESGEYAVPFMIQALRDSSKPELTTPIMRSLPQLDRGGLNPLVQALKADDASTRRAVIELLAQIPYWQSVPYLVRLRDDQQTPGDLRAAAEKALTALGALGVSVDTKLTPDMAFYQLGRAYYDNQPSLAADARLEVANVWYWREGLLQNKQVPTAIFDEVMCMRACEEALLINPEMKPALALWVAANLRRESQLPDGASDATRPAGFPTAAYFAQSAGPEYCLAALLLAVDDKDAAVAAGLIAALRNTAGPAALTGEAGGRQPLADALSFPDRVVRIRAALALAAAMPQQKFRGDQNLLPVLSEALMLHGGAKNALLVEPNAEIANQVAAALRAAGYETVAATSFFDGMKQARADLPGLDLIVLASDLAGPVVADALQQLRGEFQFAATPVLVIAKPGDAAAVRALQRANARVREIPPAVDPDALATAISMVSRSSGATPITPELGASLALESAQVLLGLAVTANALFPLDSLEPALVNALGAADPSLRITAAQVLGFLKSPSAQAAVAKVALADGEDEAIRIAMFAALAESAKRHGSQLLADQIQSLLGVVRSDSASMPLKTAASQALGALNLPGNTASEMVRAAHGG